VGSGDLETESMVNALKELEQERKILVPSNRNSLGWKEISQEQYYNRQKQTKHIGNYEQVRLKPLF
jgi:hypothetical protein